MAESAKTEMAAFLKEHPRMMGALFTLAVLLTQVQPVMAEACQSSCDGP